MKRDLGLVKLFGWDLFWINTYLDPSLASLIILEYPQI